MLRVFIVDSITAFREELAKNLLAYLPEGSQIEQSATLLNIRDKLAAAKPDVVLLEVNIPDTAEPREWFTHLMASFSVPVIAISTRAALRSAAISAGVADFIMKPPPQLLGQSFFRRTASQIEKLAAKVENSSTNSGKRSSNPMYIPAKGSFEEKPQTEATRLEEALHSLKRHRTNTEAEEEALPETKHEVVGRRGADAIGVAADMKRLIGNMKRFTERLDKNAEEGAAAGGFGSIGKSRRANPQIVVKEFEGPIELIAIGASTGGTEALSKVLSALRPPLPGVVVVQHIPPSFSKMFAERLERECAVNVKEAETGDKIKRNHIYIAPGGKHMRVQKVGEDYVLDCQPGPKVHGVCPSADVLFNSVADTVGGAALGVILTGMGRDGADGMLRMRQRGSRTLGQDEASCIVYGMPRAAFECGAVARQVSLQAMAGAITGELAGR